MTRETKIGLLVGLAFIVVFAMLLSHSGPTSPPGDMRQIVKAKPAPAAPVVAEPAPEPTPSVAVSPSDPPSASVTEGSPTAPHVDPPAPSASDPPDALPNPDILNNGTTPGAEQVPTAVTDSTPKSAVLESHHQAPPPVDVVEPHPTAREATPAISPPPAAAVADAMTHRDEPKIESTTESKEEPKTQVASADLHKPARVVASAEPPANSKEHVVQKGETLTKILKAEYPDASCSSTKLEELFMKANPKITNRAMIRENQKLVVPALPRELMEPASSPKALVDVSRKDATKVDATPGEPPKRKAPPEPSKLADAKDKAHDKHGLKDKGGESLAENKHATRENETEKATESKRCSKGKDKDLRTYEVRDKDSFSTIAKTELGSETRWKEIQRLNPDIDSSKLRRGMKLKLPSKSPMADAVASGRT